ncbi:MAG: translation elongation factor Ts [Coriobacteriia bacterium]|nr:translation elongation factor Ts [Coriobacteriia bacterium]
MAEITAQMVKELREMTGAGMMECKKALTEAEGEIDKAIDVLRTRGLAAAAKKAGRATNEGLVVALVSEDGQSAALAEVNCETDFVSRNDVFAGYAAKVAQAVLNAAPADLDALKDVAVDGTSIGDMIVEAIHTIGENIQVSRFVRREAKDGAISSYIHGGGRLGVLVLFKLGQAATAAHADFKTLAKDVAMQVAASNPGAVSRESFTPELLEHEMTIYKAQAAESGKPEAIQQKMAEGRLEKFFRENALLEQAFVKDPDQSVRDVIAGVGKQIGDRIEVVGFERYELGQG